MEMAANRRATLFKGMTVEEIRNKILIAKAHLYEFQAGKGVGVFVPNCPICGATHLHGAHSGLNGWRSPICLITDEPIPNNYQLEVDWTDQDNIRLAHKYGIEIGE